MWLIDVDTLRLRHFIGDPEPYAILSHTWGADEVSFQDFRDTREPRLERGRGLDKIRMTCEQARKDGLDYAWVDTCCINKESSAELSEAINSMFKWYRQAEVCYAYLEDICENHLVELGRSRWFTRGWTLQELVAPRTVRFYGADWAFIGSKSSLTMALVWITGIDRGILSGEMSIDQVCVAQRMKWAAKRQTTRVEDVAYCLMGIFGVNMPLLYGEGARAFVRLQEEIMRETEDQSLFAWKASAASAAAHPFRGLLASGPDEFAYTVSVIPYTTLNASNGSSITNRGVALASEYQVQPAHVNGGTRTVLAGINCRHADDFDKLVCVELVSRGGDQYVRSRPDRLFMAPGSGAWATFYVYKSSHVSALQTLPYLERQHSFHLGPTPCDLDVAAVWPREARYWALDRLIQPGPRSSRGDKSAAAAVVVKLARPGSDEHVYLVLQATLDAEAGRRTYEPTIHAVCVSGAGGVTAEHVWMADAGDASKSSVTFTRIMGVAYRIEVKSRNLQGLDVFCVRFEVHEVKTARKPAEVSSDLLLRTGWEDKRREAGMS